MAFRLHSIVDKRQDLRRFRCRQAGFDAIERRSSGTGYHAEGMVDWS
jgi:hypothetical protein